VQGVYEGMRTQFPPMQFHKHVPVQPGVVVVVLVVVEVVVPAHGVQATSQSSVGVCAGSMQGQPLAHGLLMSDQLPTAEPCHLHWPSQPLAVVVVVLVLAW
jgi:hypothetical protein